MNDVRSLGNKLIVRSFGTFNTQLPVSRLGRKHAVIACCSRCVLLPVERCNGAVCVLLNRIVGIGNKVAA